MEHIPLADRTQIEFTSLKGLIAADNNVRVVEAFVEKLDLTQLGFVINKLNKEGRPSYNSKVFFEIILLWLPQWYTQQP